MSNAIGVNLNQRIIAQGGTTERGRGAQETAVRDFLDGFANAQNQGGIHEGHDDIGIKLV